MLSDTRLSGRFNVEVDLSPARIGFEDELHRFRVEVNGKSRFDDIRHVMASTRGEVQVSDTTSLPYFQVTTDYSGQGRNTLVELVGGAFQTSDYDSIPLHRAKQLLIEAMSAIPYQASQTLEMVVNRYNERFQAEFGDQHPEFLLVINPEETRRFTISNIFNNTGPVGTQTNLAIDYHTLGNPLSGIDQLFSSADARLLLQAQSVAVTWAGDIAPDTSPTLRSFLTQFLFQEVAIDLVGGPDNFTKSHASALIRASSADVVTAILSNADIQQLNDYKQRLRTSGTSLTGVIQGHIDGILKAAYNTRDLPRSLQLQNLDLAVTEIFDHAVSLRQSDPDSTVSSRFQLPPTASNWGRLAKAAVSMFTTRV